MNKLDVEQKKLRMAALAAIINMEDREEILDSLPQAEYYEFFPLIEFYIEELNNEIEELDEFLKETTDEVEIEEYQKEKEKVTFIRDECICRKAKADMDNQELNHFLNNDRKDIIFALRSNGTPYILNDAKGSSIPEEYYQDLQEQILSFENGVDFNNTNHVKKLAGDRTVTDVWECRAFKFRLYFKLLSGDLVYAMLAKQKKSNNDKVDKEAIRNRKYNTMEEFEELKELIKDEAKKEELIKKHRQIKEDVIEYLETKKRGGK